MTSFESGHLKVYSYIKNLHSRLPSQSTEEQKTVPRPRKYSDPQFDNEELMRQAEQSLLNSLGLTFENEKKLDTKIDSRTAIKTQSGKSKLPRKYSD